MSDGFVNPTVATADFQAFNGSLAALRTAGVRIYGPNATVAQDLEPEYIAIAPDSRSARVTLQEANALAVLDLTNVAAPVVTRIAALGTKDHSVINNDFDASDRDPESAPSIRIRNWPVHGMYQPDAIAAYAFNGRTRCSRRRAPSGRWPCLAASPHVRRPRKVVAVHTLTDSTPWRQASCRSQVTTCTATTRITRPT